MSAALVAAAPALPPEPPPGDQLENREALDGVVGSVDSAHFSYRWAADAVPSAARQEQVLDALEAAWAVQFDELGFPPPPGTSAYRFNVYEGSDGLAADGRPLPLSVGAAFTFLDPDGWPAIVIGPAAWETEAWLVDEEGTVPGEYIGAVLSHELQHASQVASATWTGEAHRWMTESLSEYAAWHVWPGTFSLRQSLVGHVLAPHLAWEWADPAYYAGSRRSADPLPEGLEALHFYGGYTLLLTLEARFGAAWVVDWGTDAGDAAAALDRLDALLAAEGVATADLLAETWGRIRSGDLDDAGWMPEAFRLPLDASELVVGYAPIAGTLVAEGVWRGPEGEALPQRYGAHRWRMEAPPATVEIRLEGDPSGSAGTPTDWRVVVVTESADGASTWSTVSPPAALNLTDAAALELLVVPAADAYVVGEVFDYRLSLAEPAVASADGCGCAAARGGAAWPVLPALIPLLVWRRRRVVRS